MLNMKFHTHISSIVSQRLIDLKSLPFDLPFAVIMVKGIFLG